MIKLTEEYINKTAPNQSAVANGQGLVKKNSFTSLNISNDGNVLFGECKGSGANPYHSSADFGNPESPVFRCSCPSRQFPCKHTLGLMYAYAGGKTFTPAELPSDLAEKREKAEKRQEKQQEKQEKSKTDEAEKPKKVNKSALTKKIKTQLEGLELLEKNTYSIVQSGLGTLNIKSLKLLEEQAKQLGNYYVPGAQNALRELIVLFDSTENPEAVYTEAMDCLTRLYALCKKGKEYLNKRLEDPELPPETDTSLMEWLGHAWQLSELKEMGRVENDAELLQLSFNSYSNEARQEYVDVGVWLNLKTGAIVETRNYRPYKAAKYIREDDSFFSVVKLPEMYIYPGDMNPRVRWDTMTVRDVEKEDYLKVKSFAPASLQDVIKSVKNQIKNPLSAKYPVALIRYEGIGRVGEELVAEGAGGQRIILKDLPGQMEPPVINLLHLITKDKLKQQVMVVRFHNDMDAGRLYAHPLSIVTDTGLIRLSY